MIPLISQFAAIAVLLSLSHQLSITEGFQSSAFSYRCLTKSQTSQSKLHLAPQQLGSFEILENTLAKSEGKRKVALEDLVSVNFQRVEFNEAWDWQKHLMQEHVDRLAQNTEEFPFLTEDQSRNLDHKGPLARGGVDTFFMLEHEAVYTLGTGSDEKFITGTNDAVPIVRMDRGGEVTYHGPGQLVVYPVLDLRHYRQDIHWYMRALEESILMALKACGVADAERQDNITGIWIDNHKVAAVGVKCRKWITMHGLAVNVEHSSLDNFGGIVPCGLEGRSVGCVNQFLSDAGREPLTVAEFAKYMKAALEDVFQVELQARRRDTLPKI